jgi:hypothetical protein
MDKEIRSDAKLKNLPQDVQEDLWRMRNPEEGGEKVKFEDILVWLKSTHGMSSSLGALSEFYSWQRLRKRMDRAKSRSEQVRDELSADPSLTAEDLERAAQFTFTSEAMEGGNVKSYVMLARLRLQAVKLEQEGRKLAIFEAKARRLDEIEAKAKEIKAGGGLTAETLEMLENQLKLL